jgi:predicted esterase
MSRSDLARWATPLAALVALAPAAPAQEKGWQPECRVREPTRLDWEFVAGKDAHLPGSYDSRRQRYQLFVPARYTPARNWPLVLFVSPGDDPLGWRAWRGPCEEEGVLFAAPYGAGNACPTGQRVRAALDVLDDVRRHYRIDPERTYLAGAGGGAEVACRIAFALPELAGGVVAVAGDAPLPRLAHLRHRLQDRLSVALLCSQDDPARPLQEQYLAPLLRRLRVRARLWLVDETPGGLPTEEVVAQAQRWLEEDLKRRRADARAAGLGAEETPTRRVLARRALEKARLGLGDPDLVYPSAALLEWVVARCGLAGDAESAGELLRGLREGAGTGPELLRRGEEEARAWLAARARGLERLGDLEGARRAWDGVARLAEGAGAREARAQERRLAALVAKGPYLGLTFAGATTTVKGVAEGGPGGRAGLRAGDAIEEVGKVKVETLAQLRRQVRALRPGDEVRLGLRRAGKALSLTVRVGAVPRPD